MKTYLLLFALLLSSFKVNAQLPDGSTAPNFIATDINGEVHNLYDLLNEGKTVILDISATWCSPCWDYHESGVLDFVWEEYGPESSNEIFVLFVEGDEDTGMLDLQGLTFETKGNWIEDTPYPIIDDASIAEAYQISAYPSVYLICPDKSTNFIGQVPASDHYAASVACPTVLVGTNNVAVGTYTGVTEVACASETSLTPSLSIFNHGTNTLTSCVAQLFVDGEDAGEVTWTGNISSFGMAEIVFSDIMVNSSAELRFELSQPNGFLDEVEGNNHYSIVLGSDKKADAEVRLEIRTDFWPEETTWQLRNDLGEILYSNEDLGPLSCDNVYNQVYNLEIGRCYNFAIQDDFGDGLINGEVVDGSHGCTTQSGNANQAKGSIRLRSDRGLLFDRIAFDEIDFDFLVVEPTVVKELELDDLRVHPNPASNEVYLDFSLTASQMMEIQVYDLLGKTVYSKDWQIYHPGIHTLNFDTNNLHDGVYFIKISDGKAVKTQKIMIVK